MERRGEFAAANLQAESCLEPEHNVRWAAFGVAHATSGITAMYCHYFCPAAFLCATSSILTYKGTQGKEVEQCQSGADHNVRLHKGTVHRGYADA